MDLNSVLAVVEKMFPSANLNGAVEKSSAGFRRSPFGRCLFRLPRKGTVQTRKIWKTKIESMRFTANTAALCRDAPCAVF